MLKIKHLEHIGGTYDVYGNIADEIAVAFDSDGLPFLTKEGKEYFKDILETPITIRRGIISVDTAAIVSKEDQRKYDFDGYDSYPPVVQKISDFFWALAGYTPEENYDKWFTNR